MARQIGIEQRAALYSAILCGPDLVLTSYAGRSVPCLVPAAKGVSEAQAQAALLR